jgi:hypothetical protein
MRTAIAGDHTNGIEFRLKLDRIHWDLPHGSVGREQITLMMTICNVYSKYLL